MLRGVGSLRRQDAPEIDGTGLSATGQLMPFPTPAETADGTCGPCLAFTPQTKGVGRFQNSGSSGTELTGRVRIGLGVCAEGIVAVEVTR